MVAGDHNTALVFSCSFLVLYSALFLKKNKVLLNNMLPWEAFKLVTLMHGNDLFNKRRQK